MAQGNKSRIIIWTIVGILVVVAVVMLLTKPKNQQGQPPVNKARFAERVQSQLTKLDKKVSEAKSEFPDTPAESWQKISDDMARATQLVTEMSTMTDDDQPALRDKRDEINKVFGEARRTYKQITGREDKEEPSGGE